MARNGSGTYSLPVGNPVISGATISSTTHNNTMSDVATALTQSLAKDGQTTPTADLPMGGFKHTSVANATARNQYATVDQVQDGEYHLLGSVSGTNTIVASLTPAITAYASTMRLLLPVANTNTGATTINVNGVGAVAVQHSDGSACGGGELVTGTIAELLLVAAANAAIIVNPNVLKSRGLEVGPRGQPFSTQSGDYTFVQADNGTIVYYTGTGGHTFTLPATLTGNPIIGIRNVGSGNLTITQSGSSLSWLNGTGVSATGSRTLIAVNGVATANFTSGWDLVGSGIS